MRRRLFAIASALSLLLCIGICVLWYRSYRGTDVIIYVVKDSHQVLQIRRSLQTTNGQLVLGIFDYKYSKLQMKSDFAYRDGLGYYDPRSALGVLGISSGDTVIDWEHFGFEWRLYRPSARNYLLAAGAAPLWSLVLVTLLLPAFWQIGRWRKLRKQQMGFYANCGYDLRATPDRCPECGKLKCETAE